jgi:hypothetical protein
MATGMSRGSGDWGSPPPQAGEPPQETTWETLAGWEARTGQVALMPGETRPLAIHIGIDLAQSVDFTAITVVEVGERLRLHGVVHPRRTESFYRVHDLKRLPHGISYGEQGRLIVDLLVKIHEQQRAGAIPRVTARGGPLPRCLFVDATGLGKPVTDVIEELLDDEPRCRDVRLYPMRFRQGEQYNRGAGIIGKTYLISSLCYSGRFSIIASRLTPRRAWRAWAGWAAMMIW